MLLQTLKAASIKKWSEYRAYWFDFAVGLGIKFIIFIATLYAFPVDEPEAVMVRLFGFLLWYLTAHLLGKLANFWIEEAQLGTLVQLVTSRASFASVIMGVMFAEVIFSVPWVAMFLTLAAFLLPLSELISVAFHQALHLLIFGILGLLSMAGIGILLLGASVRFKQVGAFSEVLLFYMLFFSGFFIPLEHLPTPVRWLNFLSPLAWSVKGVEGELCSLIGLLLSGLFWFLLGCTIVHFALVWAKKQGRLTQYA